MDGWEEEISVLQYELEDSRDFGDQDRFSWLLF